MPDDTPPRKSLDLQTIVVGVVAALAGGGTSYFGSNSQSSAESAKQEIRLQQRIDALEMNQRQLVNYLNHKDELVLVKSIYE